MRVVIGRRSSPRVLPACHNVIASPEIYSYGKYETRIVRRVQVILIVAIAPCNLYSNLLVATVHLLDCPTFCNEPSTCNLLYQRALWLYQSVGPAVGYPGL